MVPDQLAASPCSHPDLDLATLLEGYAALGYGTFEAFTEWARSAVDLCGDPAACRDEAARRGMAFTSMHLPAIGEDLEAGVTAAVEAARFARALGVRVVLFKAKSREALVEAGKPFLDRIEGLGVTAAVQNHVGSPITTLADYDAVLSGIGDARLKTVLEVGMFCSVGVSWREACRALDGTVALVHLKDQIGERRVPFGEGEVDFEGLFAHMDGQGYEGEYVVEMEVCRDDPERTFALLGEARNHLLRAMGAAV